MTAPAAPVGVVATIWLALSLVMPAAPEPKSTVFAEARLVPVMVTEVAPAVVPEVGLIEVMIGAAGVAAWYVNWSAELVRLVPPVVVTVTLTTPDPAGEVAVHEPVVQVTAAAATVP